MSAGRGRQCAGRGVRARRAGTAVTRPHSAHLCARPWARACRSLAATASPLLCLWCLGLRLRSCARLPGVGRTGPFEWKGCYGRLLFDTSAQPWGEVVSVKPCGNGRAGGEARAARPGPRLGRCCAPRRPVSDRGTPAGAQRAPGLAAAPTLPASCFCLPFGSTPHPSGPRAAPSRALSGTNGQKLRVPQPDLALFSPQLLEPLGTRCLDRSPPQSSRPSEHLLPQLAPQGPSGHPGSPSRTVTPRAGGPPWPLSLLILWALTEPWMSAGPALGSESWFCPLLCSPYPCS